MPLFPFPLTMCPLLPAVAELCAARICTHHSSFSTRRPLSPTRFRQARQVVSEADGEAMCRSLASALRTLDRAAAGKLLQSLPAPLAARVIDVHFSRSVGGSRLGMAIFRCANVDRELHELR